MARLANRFGVAPIAAPQRHSQVNHQPRQPRQPNQPGGGGGGGGKKLPNTGLYVGRQGEALANQDPEKFIRDALSASGQLDFSGTAYGDYANDALVQRLLADYGTSNDARQRTSPVDFLRDTYGAGWDAQRRGHGRGRGPATFTAGTLPGTEGQGSDQYNDYQSNTDATTYLSNRLVGGGASMPGGGNTDFQQFQDKDFTLGIQRQLEAERARTGNNTLSLNDFTAGRDLTSEARQAYLFRPGASRLPGPIALAGRYSWWD